jgi:hypothetical protein
MKLLPALMGWGLAAVAGFAAETFSTQLTPAEFERAGLGKLSTAERAELDALFHRYGGPLIAAPEPKTATVGSGLSVAQPPAPRPQEAAVASAAEPTSSGFWRRAKKNPSSAAAPKPAANVIETEIDGTFTGWEETTVWTMKDGSIWRVDNRPRPYFTSRVASPKVKIYPAILNGYWIEFIELGTRVRVRRLQ